MFHKPKSRDRRILSQLNRPLARPSNTPAEGETPRPFLVRNKGLFDLDGSPGVRELLLDRRRFVLVDAFLHGLWSAIHQALGFLQPEACYLAYSLDDIDLVGADCRQHNSKFGLLFDRRGHTRLPPPPPRHRCKRLSPCPP